MPKFTRPACLLAARDTLSLPTWRKVSQTEETTRFSLLLVSTWPRRFRPSTEESITASALHPGRKPPKLSGASKTGAGKRGEVYTHAHTPLNSLFCDLFSTRSPGEEDYYALPEPGISPPTHTPSSFSFPCGYISGFRKKTKNFCPKSFMIPHQNPADSVTEAQRSHASRLLLLFFLKLGKTTTCPPSTFAQCKCVAIRFHYQMWSYIKNLDRLSAKPSRLDVIKPLIHNSKMSDIAPLHACISFFLFFFAKLFICKFSPLPGWREGR